STRAPGRASWRSCPRPRWPAVHERPPPAAPRWGVLCSLARSASPRSLSRSSPLPPFGGDQRVQPRDVPLGGFGSVFHERAGVRVHALPAGPDGAASPGQPLDEVRPPPLEHPEAGLG